MMDEWLKSKRPCEKGDGCAVKRSNTELIDITDGTPSKRSCPDHKPCENKPFEIVELEPDEKSDSPPSPPTKNLPKTPTADHRMTSLKADTPSECTPPTNALNQLKRQSGSATPKSSRRVSDTERKLKQIEREKAKLERELLKQQKEEEKQRQKEQREKEREQRELEKLQKKEQKDAELEEKRRQKEEKDAQLKAEKEKREKEKAIKDAERQAEIERKMAERKVKEEEREKIRQEQKVEEDKRKAALLVKQKIAEKSKNVMQSWLSKPAVNTPAKEIKTLGDSLEDCLGWLVKPFQLKEGMVVAPKTRKGVLGLDRKVALSQQILQADAPKEMLYLAQLKKGEIQPSHCPATEIPKTDDIICDNSNSNEQKKIKAKLFQFIYKSRDDNGEFEKCNRPPYFGSWRKKSKFISGRKPLQKDTDLLQYDIDSDGEWEEEPADAEDCQSDEEDDVKEEEDDDNDGFFVEHGYLSEGEGMSDEEGECDDPQARRERMQARAEAWKAEKLGKNRWKRLVPVIIGPCLPGVEHDHQLCSKLAELKVRVMGKVLGKPTLSDFQKEKLLHEYRMFFDTDGDGTITENDFQMAERYACKLNGWAEGSEKALTCKDAYEATWNALQTIADKDADGAITDKEWLLMWEGLYRTYQESNLESKVDALPVWCHLYLKHRFQLFDRTGDGVIDKDEYEYVMEHFSVKPAAARSAWLIFTESDTKRMDFGRFSELAAEYYFSDDPAAVGNFIAGKIDFEGSDYKNKNARSSTKR